MIAVALLLALASFGAFGLVTDGHFPRVFGRRQSASTKMRWRAAAWLAFALSAAATVLARGWAFGPVWWIGLIMFAAGTAFLILNLAVSSRPGQDSR